MPKTRRPLSDRPTKCELEELEERLKKAKGLDTWIPGSVPLRTVSNIEEGETLDTKRDAIEKSDLSVKEIAMFLGETENTTVIASLGRTPVAAVAATTTQVDELRSDPAPNAPTVVWGKIVFDKKSSKLTRKYSSPVKEILNTKGNDGNIETLSQKPKKRAQSCLVQ